MNCLSCFYWRRTQEVYWGRCDNRNGVQLDPFRAVLLTKEDFCCSKYSEKFQSTDKKFLSEKVEPVNPWDQAGDVNPRKAH